jgi:DNA repair protein RadC
MKKLTMEDCNMKTTRKKHSAEPPPAHHRKNMSQELNEIRRELADISMAIRQEADRFSQHSARYLSESVAAEYQPVSPHLSDGKDTIRFCEEHFKKLIQRGLQEELHVLTLNGAHCVIRSHQVTVGLLNSTQVHPREVFRPALLDAAASIILVHNHPSGNPKPSPEDLKVTENIEAASKLIGIKLLDHIVIARDGCTSIIEFREKRPLIG